MDSHPAPRHRGGLLVDQAVEEVEIRLLLEGQSHRRIAIFGTGQGGRSALTRLRGIGARVECFADNDPSRWGHSVEDVPIVDPGTLRARGVDFVAVASLPGRDAICAQLTRFGYHDGRDFVTLA